MSIHIETFVDYIKKQDSKSKSKSRSKSKSKSKSKSHLKNKKKYDKFNLLLNNLKINFIKILTDKYSEDKSYYDNELTKINMFHISQHGEGLLLFIHYKRTKYVFKIIHTINSDYDSLMNIQNQMAAKKLSPKIINLFSEPEKLGDTNVQKIMRKKDLVFIIMEYIDSMELRDYYDDVIKHMEPSTADKELKRIVKYFNKFLKALREIGVCHLDFTLDNILYSKTNKRIYLIDYGWMESLTGDNPCIDAELDFILKTKRPLYKQRIKSLFYDFNRDFSKRLGKSYKLVKTPDNYLKLS
jgi:serine/threonine protein kinase